MGAFVASSEYRSEIMIIVDEVGSLRKPKLCSSNFGYDVIEPDKINKRVLEIKRFLKCARGPTETFPPTLPPYLLR